MTMLSPIQKKTERHSCSLSALKAELRRSANPSKARLLSGFFKTGPGEYGEGDVFLGLTVPQSRALANRYLPLGHKTAAALLKSPVHEERLIALLLLVQLYAGGSPSERNKIYACYMRSARFINNWDLVDLSAPKIPGVHLLGRSRKPLFRFAKSKNLWERRIAAVSCLHFIRQRDFADFLSIARLLLRDEHDLIHKAVGWMLREAGKRDLRVLLSFLKAHAAVMPRTMLRYSIEKLPQSQRRVFMNAREVAV